MKINKQILINTLNEDGEEGQYGEIIEDKIVDVSRWSIIYKLIFKYKDKYYKVNYTQGATENQFERPFENASDEVEVDEVKKVQKLVDVWEKI